MVRVYATGTLAPVYNLSVRGEPEFFANGVLVHNCSAACVAFNELPQFGSEADWEASVGENLADGSQWARAFLT